LLLAGSKINRISSHPLAIRWLATVLLALIAVCAHRVSLAQPLRPEDWGTIIEVPITITTNYDIYTQSFAYADPFLITDLRSGDTNPIESYDMHTLNIYRPADGSTLLEDRPVIFFVHGGGWTDGYKDRFQAVSWSFTGQMGWITVVIDYRLTSDEAFIADQYCPDRTTCNLPENLSQRTKAAEYPDNIQDVASAFAWTNDWISGHGGDPNQIFGVGYSAGAHLLMLMGTHPNYVDLRDGLRGMAALSGPYDLDDSAFKSSYTYVLAPTFGLPLDNAELADASPQTQVLSVEWLPPVMLLHAEHDLLYFNEHTLQLAETMRTQRLPVEVVYLEDYDHNSEMGALRYIEEYPTQKIVAFFEELISPVIYLPLIQQNTAR
jgi:acetyl esterase/lipase